MKKFIFDVDGTITPSRKSIDEEFKKFFVEFASNNKVYLVTGSDREKTLDQIGPFIYTLVDRVYQCSGNDVWEGDNNIKTSDILIPEEMYEDFSWFLSESNFSIRSGKHVDKRPGLVNFSIIGRNCSNAERQLYVEYDEVSNEREKIVLRLKRKYKDYDIQIAGQTGIDIMKKGMDKSQILNDFFESDEIHFFGDRMDENGNDYSLSQKVNERGGFCYHVKDWRETWELLKEK